MKLKMCKKCVMDETDTTIAFDNEGVCNHCNHFYDFTQKIWPYAIKGDHAIHELVTYLNDKTKANSNKKYDYLLGISGGVDSSYLALKAKEFNWKVLLVHVDTGWNSELAQHNIENIAKQTGFDLFTEVIDWETMRKLQIAYIKSGVANMDVPQDHVFSSVLAKLAEKFKIKYILSGDNIASECVFPRSWHSIAPDIRSLTYIAKKYGPVDLKLYPKTSIMRHYFIVPYLKGIKFIRPLNYLNYNKTTALQELKQNYGYKEYGYKHGESIFTKYFQNYLLLTKFGLDKRKPHLSSLILTGQTSRSEAIEALKSPPLSQREIKVLETYVSKKLGMSPEELRELTSFATPVDHSVPNEFWKYKFLKWLQTSYAKFTGKILNPYI